MVESLPAVWEIGVQFLGKEDPLEKEMATHSSILAWKIPLTEEPGRLQSMGWQRVRHDWVTSLSLFTFTVIFRVQISHPYITTGKIVALTIQNFVHKWISLHFYMLPRFVITFLPRSKHLLISRLQSLSTVTLEPKKIKSVTASTFSPSICYEVMGSDTVFLVFWMLSFKPTFSLFPFIFIKRLFSSSSLYAIKVFFGCSEGKESAFSAGNLGSLPGLGRSPGEVNSNLL